MANKCENRRLLNVTYFPRDISLKQTTVNRLEELQNELKLESKQRLENEVEMRNTMETTTNKMKKYCDESMETARQITAVRKNSTRDWCIKNGTGPRIDY